MFGTRAAYTFLIFLAAGASAPAAQAQTATNLVCQGCVGSGDLKDNSVTSDKVRNGQIKPDDLNYKAKPGGAAFSELNGQVALEPTATLLRKITINAPSKGIVIANASGNPIYFSSTDPETIYCTITQDGDSQIQYVFEIISSQTGSANENYDVPISLTRAFKVKKGKTRLYFLCRERNANNTVNMQDPVLAAFFVPGIYGTAVSEFPEAKGKSAKPD